MTHFLYLVRHGEAVPHVSQALAAPAWRWLGLNQMNCALSVIA